MTSAVTGADPGCPGHAHAAPGQATCHWAAAVDASIDAVVTIDADGTVVYANQAAATTFGWSRSQLVGRPVTLLMPERMRGAHHRGLAAYLAGGPPSFVGHRRVSLEGQRRDGSTFPLEITVQEVSCGGERLFTATIRDVTTARRLEADLRRRTATDALTGLLSRSAVLDALAGLLGQGPAAVVLCDLDGFHEVNDTLGHAAGDRLLVEVADRIRAAVDRAAPPPHDLRVGRLGGDEFVVVVPGSRLDRLDAVVAAVHEALQQPPSGPEQVVAGASIGVATASDGVGASDLVQQADLAMLAAKRTGRGRWQVYDERLRTQIRTRVEDEAALRSVLAGDDGHGRLVVHLQPVVSLRSEALRAEGFEALVRWDRPGRGLVAPGGFIALAEEAGLVAALGRVVLEQTCRIGASWVDELGLAAPRIAANISACHLSGGEIVDDVVDVLRTSGLPPNLLMLEITESALADDDAPATLEALTRVGVRVALDDFGTGYSSLHRLASLPVHSLKVDRQFVAAAPTSRRDRVVLHSVAGLATALGLPSVAEGVETREQLHAVRAAGCALVQGFWFSRAVPVEQAREMLEPGWCWPVA